MSASASIETNQKYLRLEKATDEIAMSAALSAKLARLLGERGNVSEVIIPRVQPLRGGGFAIQYFVVIDSKATTFPPNFILWGLLLGENEETPRYASDENFAIHLEDLRLVIPLYPFDSRLPALSGMWNLDWQNKGTLSPREFRLNENVSFTPSQILGYRLERRCVLRGSLKSRLSSAEDTVKEGVIKILRPSAAKRLDKNLSVLSSLGIDGTTPSGLSTPLTYFTDLEPGIIVSECVSDPSLHNLPGNSIYPSACAQAGQILKNLHDSGSADLESYTWRDEMKMLEDRVILVSGIFLHWSAQFQSLFKSLKKSTGLLDGADHSVAHRDFYDKQVLYSQTRTTLVDCDTLAIADPALDYGNFIAHQFLRGLQAPEVENKVKDGTSSFVASYGEVSNKFESRASWWKAASLLRLAMIYSLRPRWRKLTGALLEQAEAETANIVKI